MPLIESPDVGAEASKMASFNMDDIVETHPQSRQVRLSTVPLIIQQRTGDKPHIATVYRWVNEGLRGVKLRTAFVGGHRRTTEAWLDEFFTAISAAHSDEAIRRPEHAGNSLLDG